MTVTTKSEDEKIECFHDSSVDKDIVFLNIPDKCGTNMVIPVDKMILRDLIKTLQSMDELMRTAGVIK